MDENKLWAEFGERTTWGLLLWRGDGINFGYVHLSATRLYGKASETYTVIGKRTTFVIFV